MAPACDLIRGLPAHQVFADKAYDADSLYELVLEQGGEPVIPPRSHRKYQHRYDRIADKQRWGIVSVRRWPWADGCGRQVTDGSSGASPSRRFQGRSSATRLIG